MRKRSNEEWLQDLSGIAGATEQRQAHADLGNYLYVVAYNYLGLRRGDLVALAGFPAEDIAALAQDFVQEALERIARRNHALLADYRGAGSFTSWAAQIVRNQAAQELRKSYWTRRTPLPQENDLEGTSGEPGLIRELVDTSSDSDPADQAQRRQVERLLRGCLDGLPERYRLAVLNCIGDDLGADVVACALATTPNAVYLIIQRAKRQLRQCLERSGLDRSVLAVFAPLGR
jgi:RNA polymerase sigma-70 factor (ECF subfamily)